MKQINNENTTIEQPQSTPAPSGVEKSSKKRNSKWLFPALLVGILIVGGTAVAYQAVFNKSPEELFASALSNTVDKIDEYTQETVDYSSVKIDGGFELTSPLPVEGTIDAQFSGQNGVLNSEVTVVGQSIKNEIKSISSDDSDAPDVYIKFDGLEAVGGLLQTFAGTEGAEIAGFVSQLDSQWFVFDGSTIDGALESQGTNEDALPELTPEEIEEVRTAVITILRERLFSSDEEKAVLEIREKIGEEKFVDTETYKLKVGVDQENFIKFLESFESIVNDTPLNKVVQAAYPGQDIDEVLQFEDIRESIESSEADFENSTAEVWIAANGGFIRNVRFFPVDGSTDNYLDFLLPLENDEVLPLEVRATVDDEGTEGVVSFGIDINKDQNSTRFWFDIGIDTSGTAIEVEAELNVIVTNTEVNVEAPNPDEVKQGTEVIDEILIGLNGPLSPSNLTPPIGLEGFNGADDLQLTPGEL